MKSTIFIKGLIVFSCITTAPFLALANNDKPAPVKINFAQINQVIADTTLPVKDRKSSEKNEGDVSQQDQVEVVKVIPKARRQPVPVPVKVNVRPVKIIKPKIIKPVLKPVIKILH